MKYEIGKLYNHRFSDIPVFDIVSNEVLGYLFCNEPFILLKSYDDFFDSFKILTKDSIVGRIILTKIYLVEK